MRFVTPERAQARIGPVKRVDRFFHLQITAAGLKGISSNSEAELFQKIPDIDTIDNFRAADEDHVIVTFVPPLCGPDVGFSEVTVGVAL